MDRLILLVFFFSSRRRHTRSYGDWSSDVCSSDLRLGADMFACAALHIQNIGAWRQRSAIFSIPIRGNSRDFFSPVPAYDDQRIFGIGFRRDGRRVSVRKLNRFPGNDMQMSLHETWPHIIRGNAPDRSQEEAADNQVLEKQYPTSLKIQAG